ncbi:hypothetical protein [Nocardioides aurantiacus]|uniref:Uncharacterized protein n=1 Tax=Nocardioides aurantiacus TaxID=86796 RepID=A0A3N2CRW2_9ACTN|nr:hypothetical protein [Nocardioides aurantiacus]ROR90277.1 hypothetical protein EDD33_1113 [Nocardioides aurantiacus]
MTGRRGVADLDYAPLTRRHGLGARLRAVAGNNVLVIGGTVAVLMTLLPGAVVVGLVATGSAGDDVAFTVCMAVISLGGLLVVLDVLGKAEGGEALDAFAEANDLVVLRSRTALHYASASFADGSHSVHRAVRTRGDLFLEIGERFPVGAPLDPGSERRPSAYLRARLAGRVPPRVSWTGLVTPEVDERLTRWSGPYGVELAGDELTVLGTEPLDARDAGRVEEGLDLLVQLAGRVEAFAGLAAGRPAAEPGPLVTASGITIPPPERPGEDQGRVRRPLVVVAWTLALVLGLPVLLAVVMSRVGDSLLGRPVLATAVVGLLVGLMGGAAFWLVRHAVTPRRRGRDAR